MAIVQWQGGAAAVAQVWTGSIDSVDGTPANNTFTVTIGGVSISAVGDTDVATTATALRASLNASTHPYYAGITWSGTTGDIIGTGDIAGVPFVAALTETGAGTGAVTDFAVTTACSGPHHVDVPSNYTGGALPVATDTLIAAGGYSMLYGLDGLSAIALAAFQQRQSFTNAIGLNPGAYAADLAGAGEDANGIPEYRETYLDVNASQIDLGLDESVGSPAGAVRVHVFASNATASKTIVHNSASTVTIGRPAIRWKGVNGNSDLEVRSAPGGIGIGVAPGEVFTIGEVLVSDPTTVSVVHQGSGVTSSSWEQQGGRNELRCAATLAAVVASGGTLLIAGEGWLITALTVQGATVTDEHRGTTDSWGTIALDSGTLELPAVQETSRTTSGTMSWRGGVLEGDFSRFVPNDWDLDPGTTFGPNRRGQLDSA